MGLFDIYVLLSSFFSIFFQVLCYKTLSNKDKINFTFKRSLLIFIIFWIIAFLNVYSIGVFKAPVCFLLIIFCNLILFNDKFNVLINTTTVSYVIALITEIFVSILMMKLEIINYNTFNDNTNLILLFTLITNISSYLLCKYFKLFRNLLNKINDFTKSNKYKIYISIVFLAILLIIDFKSINNMSVVTYILNVLLMLFISFIFLAYLNDEWKIKSELDKVDILLNNITKYEKIIEENRIVNHEILNNLILLKSFKNKNTKKYEKFLDDLILSYDKDVKIIKNISNLPKGIKGIIYYKLDELDKNNINISINISKQISGLIDKIDNDEYITLCKIIPILLDNAIYACNLSNDKKMLFEIYKEKDSLVFSIENSCYEKINIDIINNKYFSTKGENRGLGLFIVNKLLASSNKISLVQEYKDNYFISKLIFKNKKN